MKKTRLDLYLASQNKHDSRSQIKKLIEDGFVLIDGEKRKPSFLLKGGEKIEMVRRAPEIPKAVPQELPLQILHEDEDLIVINKAVGMVVHPAPGHFDGTLVNAILYHLKIPPVPLLQSGEHEDFRPGIVHRLDKGTSGVMVIAKNDQARRSLSNQFKDRTVEKTYQAVIFGKFPQKKGMISQAIGRDTQHRRKFSSRSRMTREAVTYFETGEEFPGLSLILLKPKTGRTHQLRVHLSEAHHPIVGDAAYGAKSYLSSIKEEVFVPVLTEVDRPLLHAFELKFNHPRDGRRVEFQAPLADDFRQVLDFLRKASGR